MLSTNKLTFPTAQLVLDFPSQESGGPEGQSSMDAEKGTKRGPRLP
jgi:hypothetical protein